MSTPAPPTTANVSDLPTLRPMLDEMRAAPEIVQPSAFWEHFVEQHVAQLEEDGFAHFKQTVNRQYFQWLSVDPRYDLLRVMARRWLEKPQPKVVSASLDRDLPGPDLGRAGNWAKRKVYATYVASLWEYVRRRDTLGLLDSLEEPELGDPVAIAYRGRKISEDLCNSVLELSTIYDGLGRRAPGPTGVIELGGGYGRIAWAFLKAFPGVRYVCVDIPPALAIAERYLTTLFPEAPAFGFRHFDRFEDVAEEWEAAQIAFLTPNQLEQMPPQRADVFVNVSSLHEMRPDQIAHYIGVIGRHTAGSFYTKQWKRSVNAYDDLVVKREDYPIPADWPVVFDRTHPVQRLFFEAMYRIPATA
jgi:putative sugar O-methyltransferase